MDGLVVPTGAAQGRNVRLATFMWGAGEPIGEMQHRRGLPVERADAPVADEGVDEGVGVGTIADLVTEVLSVGLHSVDALIDDADDDGQHLALRAAERRRAEHQRAIKGHRGVHRGRVEAHDAHDVVDATGAAIGGVVLGLERAGGFVVGDGSNPGHGGIVRDERFARKAGASGESRFSG